MNSNKVLIVVTLMLSCVFAVYAAGTITFTRMDNATTTNSVGTIKSYGENYEGKGAQVYTTTPHGLSASATTRTLNATPIVSAMRIQETAIASSAVATGVLYFYWDTVNTKLRWQYRNATGTVYVGSSTWVTPAP